MFTPKFLLHNAVATNMPRALVRALYCAPVCILVCTLWLTLSVAPASAAPKASTQRHATAGTAGISMEESARKTLQEHRSLRSIQENREVIVHERDRAEKATFPAWMCWVPQAMPRPAMPPRAATATARTRTFIPAAASAQR